MRSIVSALLVFFLSIVAQLVVWRVRKPRGHYTALSILAVAALVLSLGGFYAIQSVVSGLARFLPVTALDYWNFTILYTALILAYMITYSAVQADSPTMAILLRIARSGSQGLAFEEMVAELNDGVLVVPRLDDLVRGNLVELHRDRYVIRPQGACLAKTYMFYRTLLKMEKGG